MLGEMRKCPYFRSFLAFHSLVVEGDLCSFPSSLTTRLVGFELVSQTDGLQRGRMDRAALCSFHTPVAPKEDG